MERTEAIIAAKKIDKWPKEWKADVLRLTPQEREIVMLLAALVDAIPVSDEEARTTE